MNSTCPHAHVSYATWRLQVLRRLCEGTELGHVSRVYFLHPWVRDAAHHGTRGFHVSTSHARNNFKDVRRSARFKAAQLEKNQRVVQLELGENVKPGAEHAVQDSQRDNEWRPWNKNSQMEMEELVQDLHAMAKDAAANNNDDEDAEPIPFETGSIIYARHKSKSPESPLERRLPWDREKKRQVHEVEVDKKLENNVWAQILASPTRLDRSTKARIPQDLMVGFGAIQNPNDQKNYLLPYELSDLQTFKKDLERQTKFIENQDFKELKDSSAKPPAGTRVLLSPNKHILEAMTQDFTYLKSAKGKHPRVTNGARLSGALIPYRWRYKQEEMKGFQKTRQKFNEVLNREPDADEPNTDEMVDFNNLQWQPDIGERVEKIIRERVLIALEAVGRDNATGRAVHDRRVLALPIPEHGQFYLDERGRISETTQPTNTSSPHKTDKDQSSKAIEVPDWIHGAILLHIGRPSTFHQITNKWLTNVDTTSQPPPTQLPSSNLLPPTISIADTFHLPIFNLETLFGPSQTSKLHDTIKHSKIFSLDFWNTKNGLGKGTAQFDSDVERGLSERELRVPDSVIDMGGQVLSSIATPRVDGALSSSNAEVKISSAGPAGTARTAGTVKESIDAQDESYLVLVKARAQHASVLAREIWQLWRCIGGRAGLYSGDEENLPGSDSGSGSGSGSGASRV